MKALAYHVEDAAKVCGVSVNTIRRAIADSELVDRRGGRGKTRMTIPGTEL